MFDVFSQKDGISGRLIKQSDNYLVYVNTHVFNENGKRSIALGASYEVSTREIVENITFESANGAGDGFTTESVLSVLVHRLEQEMDNKKKEALVLLKQALEIMES